MKLVPYEVAKIPALNSYQKTKNQELLEEFAESGLECAKVEGWTHSSAYGCMSSLRCSIIRFRMNGIQVMVRNGEVFLIKKI